MKKNLFVLAMLMAAVGCNSETGDTTKTPQTEPASKSLFSLWESGTGTSLELTGLVFGDNPYSFELPTGTCDCNLNLTGSETSGTYAVNGCTASSGTISNADCDSMLARTGTYSKSGNELQVCQGTTCDTYR